MHVYSDMQPSEIIIIYYGSFYTTESQLTQYYTS